MRSGHPFRVKRGSADAAAAELNNVIETVKSGSLRVFGDWFGRPYDNTHVVRSAVAEGDELVLGFDKQETLRIDCPADWRFSQHEFRIEHARRVIWSWFYYGREQTPENQFTETHWVDADGLVQRSSNVNGYQPTLSQTRADVAVELL